MNGNKLKMIVRVTGTALLLVSNPLFAQFGGNNSGQPFSRQSNHTQNNHDLPLEKKRAMVIIRGEGGNLSTGFVGKLKGHLFVFSSLSSIYGSENVSLETIEGMGLRYDTAFAASEHDVVMFRLIVNEGEELPHFEIEEDTVNQVRRGDHVAIYGDHQGRGAVSYYGTNVVSMGPRVIGCIFRDSLSSGSPVIAMDSLKVIGVFSSQGGRSASRSLSRDTSTSDWIERIERRNYQYSVGRSHTQPQNITQEVYRIDTINNWQVVDFSSSRSIQDDIAKIEQRVMAIHSVLVGMRWSYREEKIRSEGRWVRNTFGTSSRYREGASRTSASFNGNDIVHGASNLYRGDDSIVREVERWIEQMRRADLSDADKNATTRRFLNSIRAQLDSIVSVHSSSPYQA